MKKVAIYFRLLLKVFALLLTSLIIIVLILLLMYKPTYAVYFYGDQIGYTDDKKKMQKEFSEFVSEKSIDEQYVELKELPQYKITFLKKSQEIDDSEIINEIKNEQITYYRYYVITENFQDKAYIDTFSNAELVLQTLADKESQNIDVLSIEERYDIETKPLNTVEETIEMLYVEKPKKQIEIDSQKIVEENKTVNTSTKLGYGKPDIGIELIKPVSGVISSVYGHISSMRSGAHSGLDIAAPNGTPYVAAADGVVTYVGYNNAFGKMLVITHGNGVQTYYCHSNKIYAKVGDIVSQGETVGEVGSTGNSSGPHLHLEVRVNGVPYNPQYYVYN